MALRPREACSPLAGSRIPFLNTTCWRICAISLVRTLLDRLMLPDKPPAGRSTDGQDAAPKASSSHTGFDESAFGAPPAPATSTTPIDNAAFASQPGLEQGPNVSLKDSFPVSKSEVKSGTAPFHKQWSLTWNLHLFETTIMKPLLAFGFSNPDDVCMHKP